MKTSVVIEILGTSLTIVTLMYIGNQLISSLRARWIHESEQASATRENTRVIEKLNNTLEEKVLPMLADHDVYITDLKRRGV